MVRKVKIFATLQDVAALEVEINDWLSDSQNVRVIQMMQSETSTPQGWNLIITIFYETG
ncbi:MAG: hypothetical protein PVJ22_07155 [Desulfobacterales bacterium]